MGPKPRETVVIFLFFLLLLAPVSAAPDLEITYLANEGFLLRAGEDAVLIDAFVAEPYSVYASLPGSLLDPMLASEEPFSLVTLSLVSHLHRDHFQPETAARFLRANPHCVLASSDDVVEALLLADPELRKRAVAILPDEGETLSREWGNVDVEFLRLSHGTGRFASIQNLGHIIHIGGKSILHVGDAGAGVARFADYGLGDRDLDVALIPYWYFSSEPGRSIIENHFVAKARVAVHIPPRELGEVGRFLAENHPDVIIFTKQGETRRLPQLKRTP